MQVSPKLPNPLLINVQTVAALLGVSTTTVRRLVWSDPSFPRPRQLGRRITRWSRAEIEAWITSLPAAEATDYWDWDSLIFMQKDPAPERFAAAPGVVLGPTA